MAFVGYSNPCHPRSGGVLNESDCGPNPWVDGGSCTRSLKGIEFGDVGLLLWLAECNRLFDCVGEPLVLFVEGRLDGILVQDDRLDRPRRLWWPMDDVLLVWSMTCLQHCGTVNKRASVEEDHRRFVYTAKLFRVCALSPRFRHHDVS
jgi:hypothetical protein